MATKTLKPAKLLQLVIDDITLDREHNIRDPKADLELTALKADILHSGRVKNRVVAHFKGGKFDRMMQGNRRTFAVKELHAEFPKDPRWNTIEAEVYNDLTEAEFIDLMIDSGVTKNLTRAEVIRACWMYLDANPVATRDELSIKMHSLLGIHFPAGSAKKTDDEIKKHYTGTTQNIMNGWKLPIIAQDVFMSKERGERKWPTKKEVATLVKIFEDERALPASIDVTKAKPGPVFMAAFNQLVETHTKAEAEGDGESRAKTISAFSRADMEAFRDNSPSSIVRTVMKLTTRSTTSADKRLGNLGEFLATIEATFTPETVARIATIMTEEII